MESNLEPQPQINTPSQKSAVPNTYKPHKTNTTLITFLIFVLPPLAYYLMIKEKRYHRWIAILLILYGSSYAILFAFETFFIAPKISSLYQQIDAASQATSQSTSFFIITFSLLELFYGIYLFVKTRSISGVSKILLYIAITILILHLFIIAYGVWTSASSFVLPSYNLDSQLNISN